jgi:hypothetical protein
MKYVLMFADEPALSTRFGEDTDPEVRDQAYKEVFAWFAEHGAAGRIAGGGAELQGVHTATTVRHGEEGPVVVDGPFSEAKEVIGGFTIVDVPDLDAALEMARSWPLLRYAGQSVEVRPIVDHGE